MRRAASNLDGSASAALMCALNVSSASWMPLCSSASFPKSIFVFSHGKIIVSARAPHVSRGAGGVAGCGEEGGLTFAVMVVHEEVRPRVAVPEEVREVVQGRAREVLEHVVESGLEHIVRVVHLELEHLDGWRVRGHRVWCLVSSVCALG